MKLTTRHRIMDILKSQHHASVKELSHILRMSRANIQHHLDVLQDLELVEIIHHTHGNRGRPECVFGLSRRLLGEGIVKLTVILFDEFLDHLSSGEREEHLRSIARRMGKLLGINVEGVLPTKINHIVNTLNKLNYQAHWEATGAGAKVTFKHCPYAAIIDDNPDLCLVDLYLLEKYLERDVIKIEHTLPQSGFRQCVFLVQ